MSAPRLPRLLAALCVTVTLSLLCCSEWAAAQVDCGSIVVCQPYSLQGPACVRKKRINLRFMLETSRETNFTVGTEVHHLATYGFCPVVDQLSSFTLPGAPFLSTSYSVTNTTSNVTTDHLSAGMFHRYLSVYGFGASNDTLYPQTNFSGGTVVVAMNGTGYSGVYASVAVVTMLSLEIGMHNGMFNYIGAKANSTMNITNPNYNLSLCHKGSAAGSAHPHSLESSSGIDHCDPQITVPVAATVVQPAKVGFVPTCNANDVCVMGDPNVYTCIGDIPGQKNCGIVSSNATLLRGVQLVVWVSYFGTDSQKTVLLSGGVNPMNFMAFASNNALNSVANKFTSLYDNIYTRVTSLTT
ncbi:hypothetical protein NESM_000473100 [Novymonas esmeraldas]|uniref:Membrane-associated protein n=1 Tax=Novymonas esmeraldas TaxID=1808958 RepID=A0AAW0EP48_9TRYP